MSDRDVSPRSQADGTTSSPCPSRQEWEALPSDPDPQADLGYDPLDLEVFDMEANDQVMVLPRDEDMVREDAFIIATSTSLCDVDANR